MRVARGLLYATLLVPILVIPGFLFPFVTIRAVYFRVLVELCTAILLYVLVRRDVKANVRDDFVFWALLAWVVANSLAAWLGVAPIRSLFGDHERMGGVWFWLHLVAYYVALRTFMRPDDWWRFFRIAVAVSAAVAAFGLMTDKIHSFHVVIGGIGGGVTIGNSGLLAAYLAANVAFCILLAVHSGTLGRLAYGALALLLVFGMATSGNRSSALALLVGAAAGFAFSTARSARFRSWRFVAVIALFAAVATLPFVTRSSWARPLTARVSVLERLSSGVDSARVVQWRAAIDGIRARPLLGVGPENYQIVWSQYYHPEMYRFAADSRWDRAHNAYLDAFATAGILGFLCLLAIWLALGRAAWNAAREPPATGADHAKPERAGRLEAVAFGAFAAYAFYLLFWFFDLNSTMPWIALAAFIGGRAAGRPLFEIGARGQHRWQSSMVVALGAMALVAVLYVHGYETLRMARTLDRVRHPDQPMNETFADFESVFSSVAPVTQHAFFMYSGRLRDLQPRFPEIRADPVRAQLFNRAFVLGLTEFERQARQDPLNERMVVQHARVLLLGAYFYGDTKLYESALARLQHAVSLAPRRVNTYLVLGVAYLNAKRPDLAKQAFQQAYSVYPPLGQTHSYLAEAYLDLDKPDSAAWWLRNAMQNEYAPSRELTLEVAHAAAAAGHPRAAAELTLDYLRREAGPPFTWSVGPPQADIGKYDLGVLAARFFMAAGDPVKASVISATAPGLCARPVRLESLPRLTFPLGSPGRVADCREPWRLAEVF